MKSINQTTSAKLLGLCMIAVAVGLSAKATALPKRINHGKVFSVYTYKQLEPYNDQISVLTYTNTNKTARFPVPRTWNVSEDILTNGFRYTLTPTSDRQITLQFGFSLSAYYDDTCDNSAYATFNKSSNTFDSVELRTINGWESVVSIKSKQDGTTAITYYTCKDTVTEFYEFIAPSSEAKYLIGLDTYVSQVDFYLP